MKRILPLVFSLLSMVSLAKSDQSRWPPFPPQARCECTVQSINPEATKVYSAESWCFATSYAKKKAMDLCEAENEQCELKECHRIYKDFETF